MNKKLHDYILICGGQSEVARELKVHRKTVWVWETKGFPHTEWSGATTWTDQIAKLCCTHGFQVTGEKILQDSM